MAAEEAHAVCRIEDGIAEVTLNRPDRMNAYTTRMGVELNGYLRECGENDEVRAIIVTGAGRAFCAGADLGKGGATFDRDKDDDARKDERERIAAERIDPWDVPKPIIAAINGHAVGVGLTLPLQYDLRIVANEAKLGFAFTRRGIMPELASTWIVPRLIGIARACDLMMTGRIFMGDEAARLGLANEAVPKEEVLDRARAIARDIATNCAPVSVAMTKRMIWEHLRVESPSFASERESAALWTLGRSDDAREGVTAFLEKREPKWTMRPSVDLPEIPALGSR
jgi:enoyl-CoA hydratase/carnithine racemase